MSNSKARNERRKKRYYKPHIIGYYPKQVVALRIPANPDQKLAGEAREKARQLAKSISSYYA